MCHVPGILGYVEAIIHSRAGMHILKRQLHFMMDFKMIFVYGVGIHGCGKKQYGRQ
jgi:hypothetical protein